MLKKTPAKQRNALNHTITKFSSVTLHCGVFAHVWIKGLINHDRSDCLQNVTKKIREGEQERNMYKQLTTC